MSKFDDVYRQHADAVFRVCLRSVSRREIAEELTSEVFLQLHQNWERIDTEQLPAWLFTVAKRRAADYWRRWYLEDRWAAESQPEQHWSDPEFSLETLLGRCAELKSSHRACLVLRFAHGMSREEIARQTGLTELQVKANLQYGLKLMRDVMTPSAERKGESQNG